MVGDLVVFGGHPGVGEDVVGGVFGEEDGGGVDGGMLVADLFEVSEAEGAGLDDVEEVLFGVVLISYFPFDDVCA